MKVDIPLPTITFSLDIDAVRANRDVLKAWREAYKGAIKALEGLSKANQGMCKHLNKVADYDPGYAGGGFCGYVCPDCGRSNV